MKRLTSLALLWLILILSTPSAFTTETTNYGLGKPAKGARGWDTTINANMDTIDDALGDLSSEISDSPEVLFYSDKFNGPTGTTVTLPKTVSAVTEYGVAITPTTRAEAIGDIYVTKTVTNFVVKCAEANVTDTFVATLYYTGDLNAYGESVYREWIVSASSTIIDHGLTTTAGSIKNLIDAAGSDQVNITLPGNHTYPFLRNCTFPATTTFIYDRGAILDTDYSIRSSSFSWVVSPSDADEWTLRSSGGGNPNIQAPYTVIEDSDRLADGTAGSLSDGEWDWADKDGLGYSTVYMNPTAAGDPDLAAEGYFEAGILITHNGLPVAPPGQQIFAGQGVISFGDCAITILHTGWWGLARDGATDDTATIQDCLTAADEDNLTVDLGAGEYAVTQLDIPVGVNVIGGGEETTILHGNGTTDTITNSAKWEKQEFKNFSVTHEDNTLGSGIALIDAPYGAVSCVFKDLLLTGKAGVSDYGMHLHGEIPGAGAGTQGVFNNILENVRVQESTGTMISAANIYSAVVADPSLLDNQPAAIYLDGSDTVNQRANINSLYRCHFAGWPIDLLIRNGHVNNAYGCKSSVNSYDDPLGSGLGDNRIASIAIVDSTAVASSVTTDNNFFGWSFDSWDQTRRVWLYNTTTAGNPYFANFYGCRTLQAWLYDQSVAGGFHADAVAAPTCTNDPDCVPVYGVFGDRGNMIAGTAVENVSSNYRAGLYGSHDAGVAAFAGSGDRNSGAFLAAGPDFDPTAPTNAIGPHGSASIQILDHASGDAEFRLFRKAAGANTYTVLVSVTDDGLMTTTGLGLGNSLDEELTIATGAITVTDRTSYRIDTEGDAATDNLDTINGGTEGQVVTFTSANSGRDVTFMDGTGNIQCGSAKALTTVYDEIVLKKQSTYWKLISSALAN